MYWMPSRVEYSKSFTSTSKTLAISNSVSRLGWAVFVHHFDTVAGSFPNCSASHLLVRFFSTSTTLIRFMSFVVSISMGNVVLVADKGRKYSQKIAIYGLYCAKRMAKNINFVMLLRWVVQYKGIKFIHFCFYSQ